MVWKLCHWRNTRSYNIIPKFEVVIDTTRGFTCLVFGFKVTNVHDIYKQYRRSMTNIAIQNLFFKLGEYAICDGVDAGSENAIIHHVIPRETNPGHFHVQVKHYRRLPDCHVLVVLLSSRKSIRRCRRKNRKAKYRQRQKTITKKDPRRLKQRLKL